MLETLMDLGLTYLQAKSYLAFAQLDKAEVRTIAKLSDIARQDIYRIMPTLEKLGLAEKIVATPVLYKPTPLDEGFKMLLQKKAIEEKMLRKKVKNFLSSKPKANTEATIYDDNSPQFIIISEKKLLLKKMQMSFIKAKTCDFEFPGFTWNFTLYNFSESMNIALAKRAKIRIVAEKENLSPLANKKLEALMKSPFFEIRYSQSSLDFGVAIFDGKEVNVCVSSEKSSVPSMWSNNPQLLTMAQTTFEHQWDSAQDFDNFPLRVQTH